MGQVVEEELVEPRTELPHGRRKQQRMLSRNPVGEFWGGRDQQWKKSGMDCVFLAPAPHFQLMIKYHHLNNTWVFHRLCHLLNSVSIDNMTVFSDIQNAYFGMIFNVPFSRGRRWPHPVGLNNSLPTPSSSCLHWEPRSLLIASIILFPSCFVFLPQVAFSSYQPCPWILLKFHHATPQLRKLQGPFNI